MRPRALLALGAALAWVAPLPVAGAPVAERAIPVVDLNVHLPYQLARGQTLLAASGQADARRRPTARNPTPTSRPARRSPEKPSS